MQRLIMDNHQILGIVCMTGGLNVVSISGKHASVV